MCICLYCIQCVRMYFAYHMEFDCDSHCMVLMSPSLMSVMCLLHGGGLWQPLVFALQS